MVKHKSIFWTAIFYIRKHLETSISIIYIPVEIKKNKLKSHKSLVFLRREGRIDHEERSLQPTQWFWATIGPILDFFSLFL